MHICCAPCAIYPLDVFRQEGVQVMGFFYRHNIHPYQECLRRQKTLEGYAKEIGLEVIYQQGYELEKFLQNAAFREADRCRLCYHDRLKTTALMAKRGKFDGFTSTLLYSKYQQHRLIQTTGEAVGRRVGIPFIYQDFRSGWQTGIAESKRLGMYRQQYCGCIYSEKERYYRPSRS